MECKVFDCEEFNLEYIVNKWLGCMDFEIVSMSQCLSTSKNRNDEYNIILTIVYKNKKD